jgi:hypothetical protein
VEIEYFCGKVTFAHIRYRKYHAMLIDSARFFTMSLHNALDAADLSEKKLPHPPGLGSRIIPMSELKPYLTADVLGVRALGEKIIDWHKGLNLYPSVSVAQMSMRTFRRRFVAAKFQAIPGTPGAGVTPGEAPVSGVLRASLCAYHAGRNGLYCRAGWRRVKILDLNSAFPAAMKKLPSFARGVWRHVTKFSGSWGFYRLYGGMLRQGTYPILFDHGFTPLPDGPITRPVWVSGHELGAALSARLLTGLVCSGYVWRPESSDHPFADFVAHYWRERQDAKTKDRKNFVKLVLNSLYGKMISRIELDEVEEGENGTAYTHVSGGQFYPVAAAWITAQVRVWLWRKERAACALHSATDGVMIEPDTPARSTKTLGGWKVEVEGWALILRNKFYLVFSHEGELLKWAFHGFDGTALDLITMLKTGRAVYPVARLRGWFEAAAAGLRPFANDRRTFSVKCNVRGFWPPPFPVAAVPVGDGFKRIVYVQGL